MNPAYTPLQESLIQLLRAHQLGALHLVPRLIRQIEREWKREGQLGIFERGTAHHIESANSGVASNRLQSTGNLRSAAKGGDLSISPDQVCSSVQAHTPPDC